MKIKVESPFFEIFHSKNVPNVKGHPKYLECSRTFMWYTIESQMGMISEQKQGVSFKDNDLS